MDLSKQFYKKAYLTWALAKEAGAAALTYELVALNLLRNSTPVLPPLRKPQKKNSTPVIFVHGLSHNPSAFAYIKQQLVWNGWHEFIEVPLYTSFRSVKANAETIARKVEAIIKKNRASYVDIIAHSMGGIISRYFVQALGGEARVGRLITLGTPHLGTNWSRLPLLPHLRELSPLSKTIQELNALPLLQKTHSVAISGELDFMIHPRENAHWKGARNIKLKGLGHAGLLFSKRVSEIVMAHLR